MHDSATPDHDPQSARDQTGEPSPDGRTSNVGTAAELVDKVIAWYSHRMLAEQRAGAGPEVLRELAARRRACVEDRDRLEDANGQETARLAALYAALLKDLKSS
ncbi:hypothetical protein [Streptomyces sp. NBC_01243]|uniref:hypothetical protein n=1 Tax=Streptomyces sp. NBC_01243 TaxID=2903796 RepID=UPI002E0E2ED4|nr:hypothetical protein OG348_42565 [Streptomyces sp. NBC_01243]